MNLTLPIRDIQGEPLTHEQELYLDGLFAGLRQRGYRFTDLADDPIARSPAETTPPILEERIKNELHPLDAFAQISENARTNQPPDKEAAFRFKWHGLFFLAPAKEGFMARLRIPGGQVKSFQLREIAMTAKDLTSGYVQITTRANFQIRLIEPRHAPEVLRRIQSVGLHTRGAGADNIRNLTTHATSGFDPNELIDTLPACHELAQIIINDRAFYNLPRKFNIAFDGGGLIGSLEDTNDIGVRAVRILANDQGIEPGIYYRVALGGATGHQAFARDLGVLVPPVDVVGVIAEIVRVYIDNGNRGHRKKARLKHLLDDWDLARYLAEVEMRLGRTLIRAPLDEAEQSSIEETRQLPKTPHSHIGVYPQRQNGLFYIGVALPAGQITPKQMLRLADLADHYGSGEVRLTVWQNLLLPGIPEAYVETVKKALVKMGLDWRSSNVRGGIVACTGKAFCKYAQAHTKRHALELGQYLEKRIQLDQPVNIHLTGCPHSCAQHYIGDIGLLATPVKVNGESVEGYHVFIGGGFGDNRAIGRQIYHGLSFESMMPAILGMLRAYLDHREAGETFQNFSMRHDLKTIQEIFEEEKI